VRYKYFQLFKVESILIGFFVAIAVFAYFFGYRASNQLIQSKEDQWRGSRSEMERMLKEKKMGRDLAVFVNLLEDQQHYADVINRPMLIAKKYHLNVPSVVYQKESVEDDFLKVTFSFSVNGAYESIRQFISDIESQSNLYVIEDMTLGKTGAEAKTIELQLKMTTLLKGKG